MHKTIFALAFAAMLSTPASFAAETPAAPAAPDAAAAPAAKPLTAEQKTKALETFGWVVAQGRLPQPINVEIFGFSADELDVLLRGFRIGAEGQELKNIQETAPLMEQFLGEKFQANRPKLEEKSKARLQEWREKNKDFLRTKGKEAGVEQTATGLYYKIITPGTAPKPTATSSVKAKYTGKLVDGNVFDSTDSRNGEPTEFPLSGVIPGWTEGLQKIGKGGKIQLFIPSELGYGEAGQPPSIPPASTLVFDVEIVEVINEQKAPAAPTAPAAGK
jgi:FKBP-type peptidyl-prolyl cis-trans isomerase